MKVRTAVIPVAGLGTRMLPATKAIPKELVPVVAKPAIQWVVESIAAAGVERVVLVTSAGKSAIEDHFDRHAVLEQTLAEKGAEALLEAVRRTHGLARIVSVRQPEPLGLGHAVLMARDVVGHEPFAVVLPDELVLGDPPPLAQCLAVAEANEAPVLGLVRVPRDQVSRYGIVRATARDAGTVSIEELVEKPDIDEAPSDLAISGPYVLVPEVFDAIETAKPGRIGEVQLTDALQALADQERGLLGRLIEGERLDTGHPLGFVQANVAMGLADGEIGAALRRWLQERLRGS